MNTRISICCIALLSTAAFAAAAGSPFTAEESKELPGWTIRHKGKPLLVWVTQGKFRSEEHTSELQSQR